MSPKEEEKYEVLEKIGHGSFGIIRKVQRKCDGKILCRKEINYNKMSARERAQLAAEHNILKSLKHENIVAYFHREHWPAISELHLYMEFCGGGDLSTKIKEFKIKKQKPSEEYVWDIVGQLASALYRCHEGENAPPVPKNVMTSARPERRLRPKTQLMILHRDLKPENIFLGEDDSVKLGDFGLSKEIGHNGFATTYVGTPYYMSPEICASENYGWHSDIWAMGCIIYELCTGMPPFNAKTHVELASKIVACKYDSLPDVFSRELDALINKCLQRNPMHRPKASDIIEIPIVRMMRKGRELLSESKALDASKAELKDKIIQSNSELIKLQTVLSETKTGQQALIEKTRRETVEAMRIELDNTVRLEWEVKAQLEISKHCDKETIRLQGLFESELKKRVAIEVAAQLKAQRNVSGTHTPPLSALSRLSFDSPESRMRGGQLGKRTPFARAQTQLIGVESPMDIQMASPSPICTSLALSPRKTAAMTGRTINSVSPTNMFKKQAAAKDRWQPQLVSENGSEDERDDSSLDSLIPEGYISRDVDPFMTQSAKRPGLKRQSTVPVNTASKQSTIFSDKTAAAVNIQPRNISPSRKPNGILKKAVTTAGLSLSGKTLIEHGQDGTARVGNNSVQTPSAKSPFFENIENLRPSISNDAAYWDPEIEVEMPSPFLARRGRGLFE